jgi:hypothetical protein
VPITINNTMLSVTMNYTMLSAIAAAVIHTSLAVVHSVTLFTGLHPATSASRLQV